MFGGTPLHDMKRFGEHLGVDLWVKRDDLAPLPGGGAKSRKIEHILRAATKMTDALVTTGGTQSNHARVTALVAAIRGYECELILHGDPEEMVRPTGNLLLMLLSGAKVRIVDSDGIGPALELAVDEMRSMGLCPLLIEGGGHNLEGALALVYAMQELASQSSVLNWIPDYIIHASGTGGTQAGLVAGVEKLGWSTRVIGISVARSAARGGAIVSDLYHELRQKLGLRGDARTVEFLDDWTGSGYGKPLPDAADVIRQVASLEGVPLDPTYTSKAMIGLIDLVKDGIIPKGSKVLFWHTGGLLNLVSAPIDWGTQF